MPRTTWVVMPRSQINRRPYDVPANIADVCTSGRHRGTAVGNSWHRMDIVRCPHGHRAMSQPIVPKYCHEIGRRPAGFRPEIGRFPYGNPTMEHTSYDHRGIIGQTPEDYRAMSGMQISSSDFVIVWMFYKKISDEYFLQYFRWRYDTYHGKSTTTAS